MINPFSSHASHPTVKTPGDINFCCSRLRVDCVGAWCALLRLLLLSSLMLTPDVVFVFGLLSCLSAHSYPTDLPKFIWKLNWTCDNPGAIWKKKKTSKKFRRMFYLCCVFTNGTVGLSRILTTNVIKGRFQANIHGMPYGVPSIPCFAISNA